MAAIASIEDLGAARDDLKKIEKKYPEAYAAFVKVLNDHKMIGYKNIARLANGKTPEELKE